MTCEKRSPNTMPWCSVAKGDHRSATAVAKINKSGDGSVVHEAIVATSGPIPSADQLRQYDGVLPGLAERIVSMAEKEQQRRHAGEIADENLSVHHAQIVETNSRQEIKLKLFGQVFGFVIAAAVVWLALTMCKGGAFTSAAAMVSSVVVALIWGRTKTRNMPPPSDET